MVGTCQRGVQAHLVSISRTFEKQILDLWCLFEARRPSGEANGKSLDWTETQEIFRANLHQFLLLTAQLFRSQFFPENFLLMLWILLSLYYSSQKQTVLWKHQDLPPRVKKGSSNKSSNYDVQRSPWKVLQLVFKASLVSDPELLKSGFCNLKVNLLSIGFDFVE